jgi:hypothetical protein
MESAGPHTSYLLPPLGGIGSLTISVCYHGEGLTVIIHSHGDCDTFSWHTSRCRRRPIHVV